MMTPYEAQSSLRAGFLGCDGYFLGVRALNLDEAS
jgi:hypothetical protein